jgi:hypothetical protein
MNSDLSRKTIQGRFGKKNFRAFGNRGTHRTSSPWRVGFGLEALEARMVLASDFGDAPLPYATLLAENGPRHEAIGPTLGDFRDSEADGIHSASADADDTAGLPDDEDGVSFGSIRVGQLGAAIVVHVANAPSGAKLDAWIDFNRDGTWGGPLEQIANSLAVVNGDNAITFDVPGTAVDGISFARFRLSTAGNLGVRGAASDGEVEDHAIAISPPIAASGVFGHQNTISNAVDTALSVVAADMDRDGDLDVLSASFNDDKIVWYENDGNQNFTASTITTTANGARSIVAADVDGDGDMDILSASSIDDKIAWHENDGSQHFMTRIISTAADGAFAVFAADMDGDGDLDVLSASNVDDKIAWYENDGSESFTLRTISTAIDGSNSVSAADMDGDGDLDILSSGSSTIAWFDNDGGQIFTPRTISNTAAQQPVVAADVDGDGDLDVLSAGSSISWYENNGSQVFTAHSIDLVAGTTSVFATDVDGDGDMDALATSFSFDRVILYVNNGSQVFTSRNITTAADGARSVVAADMDRDGDLDVLSASFNDDKIAWYENLPNRTEIDVRGNNMSIAAGDMTPSRADYTDFGASFTTNGTIRRSFSITNNGGLNLSLTGSPRVAVGGVNANDFVVTVQPSSPVAPAGGTTTFTVVFDPSSSGTRSATISIANNDLDEGLYEFALTGMGLDLPADFGDAPSPYPTTLVENGASHAATGPTLGTHRDSEANGVHSPLADADDTAGVPNDEDGVTFPSSMSAGQLGAQITVHVTDAPAGAKLDAWIDFNGDGNWGDSYEHIAPSIAVVNGDNVVTFDVPSGARNGTTYARVRLSTAGNLAVSGPAADGEIEDYTLMLLPPVATAGVFSAKTIPTSTDSPFAVQTADLDGDGDLDVVAASLYDDRITWYENNGAGSFTSHSITTTVDWPWWVYAADIDGDGDTDVLSASNYDDRVTWYENDSTPAVGLWTAHIISNLGDNNETVYVADVDSDGDMDVLSASCGDNTVAWHENNGAQNFTRHIISSVEGCAVGVETADVDGDGDLDILTTALQNSRLAWYENNGSQSFTRHIVATNATRAVLLRAADLDNDGDMDLVSEEHGNENGARADNKFVGYENDGAQNFTPYTIAVVGGSPDAPDYGGFAVADMDGDGRLDVVPGVSATLAWYKNDGTPAVGPWVAHTVSTTASANAVVAGDLDGDGDLDLVASTTALDTIAWYENLPDGDFDNDDDYDCADVNALTAAVVSGGSAASFDLNGDDVLSVADVDQWRVEAGNANLGAGRVYRVGDANLDGTVDGSDFSLWNAAKFTNNTRWCDGNFNADSVIDGTDFGLWNRNKFTSSDAADQSVTDIHMALRTFPSQPRWELTPACRWVLEDGIEASPATDPRSQARTVPMPTRHVATAMAYGSSESQHRSSLRRGLTVRHEKGGSEMATGDPAMVDAVLARWRA